MKIAALQREMLVKAQRTNASGTTYRKDVAAGKKPTPPERDLNLEPLVEVLERKRTVHFHCHRADDIMTAVRLSEGVRLRARSAALHRRLSHRRRTGQGGHLRVADPGRQPRRQAGGDGPARRERRHPDKAGVKVAINTDDSVTESRFFLRTGAIAVRGGLSEDVALKALTLHGAQMLHLDDRFGSLDKGKDADFVVLSGAPFSVYTQVLETYIEGVKVFDRSVHQDWTYQAGGFALARTRPNGCRASRAAIKPWPAVKTPAMPDGAAALDGPPKTLGRARRPHPHGRQGDASTTASSCWKTARSRRSARARISSCRPKTPVVTAAVVTPGLIDAHAVVGLTGALNFKKADQDQDEMSDPNQADLRVLDSFNPNEPLLQFVREHGVTVVHAMPGPANVIAGQTGIFRTYGRTVEQMNIRFPAGMLVNLGEIPKSSYPGKLPNTRMGTANLVRNALQQAQSYAQEEADRQGAAAAEPEARSPGAGPEPKIPVIFAAHRADDIMTGPAPGQGISSSSRC